MSVRGTDKIGLVMDEDDVLVKSGDESARMVNFNATPDISAPQTVAKSKANSNSIEPLSSRQVSNTDLK